MARESYRRGVSGENAPGVGSEGRRRTSSFPAHPSIGKSWVGRPMDRQGIRERVNQRTRRSAGAGSARTVRPDRVRCTRSAGGHGRAPSDVTHVFTDAAHNVETTGTAETVHRTGSRHRHLEEPRPSMRMASSPVKTRSNPFRSYNTLFEWRFSFSSGVGYTLMPLSNQIPVKSCMRPRLMPRTVRTRTSDALDPRHGSVARRGPGG